ncbi:DUF413 domain-containing protein [Colwellia sp. MEBiC06753]
MDTSIRVGKTRFYANDVFPYGLSRSSYFNKRESDELIAYGSTLHGLASGIITPENEEEQQFIEGLMQPDCTLYTVKLWRKFLMAVEHRKTFHGFSPSSKAPTYDINVESSNDEVDDIVIDGDMELVG